MKNTIYKYFFHEFFRYFAVVLFALTAVIWIIQAVNFLDLVIEDGHAFSVYILYSFFLIPKMLTKLIPLSFLISAILTISKLEKDNELIILWTAGLNKMHIVNLIFRISLIVMVLQIFMSNIVTPQTLNKSRSLLKNSELQFVPSLLKVKTFNDTVEGLTIFVESKNINGEYKNIFIRDDGNALTQISSFSSTIFAKSGYMKESSKKLILKNGNIQKINESGHVSIVKFDKTEINISGLSAKSISEPKLQETSTINILKCLQNKNISMHNCEGKDLVKKDIKIEINKRFGIPIFIPLIALISCFVLTSRKEKKNSKLRNHIFFILCFILLIIAEISVRYSGISFKYTLLYYFMPVSLLPIIYFFLIRTFKFENLN